MTVLWFGVWLVANLVGGDEPLKADPVNAWTATLILAVALDLGRAGGLPERTKCPASSNSVSARRQRCSPSGWTWSVSRIRPDRHHAWSVLRSRAE